MNSNSAFFLVIMSVLGAVMPAPVRGSGFPIATTAQAEHGWDSAFDGTNFLVGVQQDITPGGSIVGAKLVSPTGTVLATAFAQRTGDPPSVAFGGTNYLLAWADHDDSMGGLVTVYGQLVNLQGNLIGAPALLSQSTTVLDLGGVAFDGTQYLVVWNDARRAQGPPTPGDKDVYGRFVSATGVPVGNEFKISDGAGKLARIAFGTSGYLVTWNEDVFDFEMRARVVTPAGVLQPAFTVNGSAAPSDTGHDVAFDGTNFLVVWGDEVSGPSGAESDLTGQLVSASGSLVGSPIAIATTPGSQALPFIAADGTNFLVAWSDAANDADGDFACDPGEGTCIDVYTRFFSPSGTPVGSAFLVVNDADNQGESPVVYGNGQYLVAWNDRFETPAADLFGRFIGALPLFANGFE